MIKFETRAVAASVYGKLNATDTMLTHSVELTDGAERVLCNRVKLEHLLDDIHATDPNAAPTCKHCARKLAKAA